MNCYRLRDITDCGAACFAFVAHHYRLQQPVARLRQLMGTGRKGTTAAGLVEAARQLGLMPKGM